jgi:hypothetical protein
MRRCWLLAVTSALKMILCTGQHPREVVHMRREHIKDCWWIDFDVDRDGMRPVKPPGAPPGRWADFRSFVWYAKH